jgi:hypothetical protein
MEGLIDDLSRSFSETFYRPIKRYGFLIPMMVDHKEAREEPRKSQKECCENQEALKQLPDPPDPHSGPHGLLKAFQRDVKCLKTIVSCLYRVFPRPVKQVFERL